MQKEIRLEFSQSIDKMYAAYTDADFIKAKNEALGASEVQVDVVNEGKETRITVKKEIPVDAPKVLQRFAGERTKVTQTEVWRANPDGSYFGILELNIHGAPVTVKSTMRLLPEGEGCAAEIVTSVKSNVPFLGKIMDNFMAETAEKEIEKEFWYMNEQVN